MDAIGDDHPVFVQPRMNELKLSPVMHNVGIQRCRLYKVSAKGPHGKFVYYTEVWDTMQQPTKDSELPRGELVKESRNLLRNLVREEMNRFIESLGDVGDISNWRDHGMI